MNTKPIIIALLVLILSLSVSSCGSQRPPTKVSSIDGMTLVYVPAGEFIMGSNDGDFGEKPERTIYLDAFWIDKTK